MPELHVQTDFLVVGAEPYIPSRPDEFDQAALDLYNQELQKFNDYMNTIGRATDLSIPMLNHKRFLYLLGLGDRSPLEPIYAEQ